MSLEDLDPKIQYAIGASGLDVASAVLTAQRALGGRKASLVGTPTSKTPI